MFQLKMFAGMPPMLTWLQTTHSSIGKAVTLSFIPPKQSCRGLEIKLNWNPMWFHWMYTIIMFYLGILAFFTPKKCHALYPSSSSLCLFPRKIIFMMRVVPIKHCPFTSNPVHTLSFPKSPSRTKLFLQISNNIQFRSFSVQNIIW